MDFFAKRKNGLQIWIEKTVKSRFNHDIIQNLTPSRLHHLSLTQTFIINVASFMQKNNFYRKADKARKTEDISSQNSE